METLINQCRLENVAHILSVGILEKNKSEQLQFQTVLNNSDFSQYLVDVFSSVEQNDASMSAIEYRLTIGRELLSKILFLRNSLTRKNEKKLCSNKLFQNSNGIDKKFPFDMRKEEYKNEIFRLQKIILDILSCNKRVKYSDRLLNRRLSLSD